MFDLGHQPLSNDYLKKNELDHYEVYLPLKLFLCSSCGLLQIPAYKSSLEVFKEDYAYLSSTSKTLCDHAESFVNFAIRHFNLDSSSFVVEIASNDGYLLEHVIKKSIPCLGVEPTKLAGSISKKKKINTLIKFFSYKISQEIVQNYKKPDLIIANNVLPHVPNINDFLKGLSFLISPEGVISVEFQHLLSLIKHNLWDTIYHEHYSYLTLNFFKHAIEKIKLKIFDVQIISTHGGSLRVFLKNEKSVRKINEKKIDEILKEEKNYFCKSPKTYLNLQKNALTAKLKLIEFLVNSKNKNKKVIAYGAAAKGNTLLNYSGIKSDLLPYVIDKAKSKQGSYLPGSHILVTDINIIKKIKPDIIIILAWNIIDEVMRELIEFKNIEFYVAIPKLTKIKKNKDDRQN